MDNPVSIKFDDKDKCPDILDDKDFKKAVKYLVEESWRDYNFESAVKNIVDYCTVNVDGGYVSGDYIYGMHGNISC